MNLMDKNSSDILNEKKRGENDTPHDLADVVEADDGQQDADTAPPEQQDTEVLVEKKYHEAWLRACADLENMRRRREKEMEEYAQYGHMVFAKELLAVADNLDRALLSVSSSDAHESAMKAFYDGVCLTQKTLEKVFATFHITKIQALNMPFSPLYHEAVGEKAPSPGHDIPDGNIVEVLQDGYLLKDRVLRPAMVMVAKNHVGRHDC